MQEYALGSAGNYCDSQGCFWVGVQKNGVRSALTRAVQKWRELFNKIEMKYMKKEN